MKETVLFLDLDETIFRTGSMDPGAFKPFFDHLSNELTAQFSPSSIKNIIDDLWLYTWDKVMEKHHIPLEMIMPSIRFLDGLPLHLNIRPFPDYTHVRTIPCRKFLVTTSLTSLQNKKIDALGIRNDFEEILINDTFISKKNKQDLFSELVQKHSFDVSSILVVGDNPESEIRAGNALGMKTVQVVREGIKKGDNADFYISDFSSLQSIISALP